MKYRVRRGFSKTHFIDDGVWQWKYSNFSVLIVDPNNKFTRVHACTVCCFNSGLHSNLYYYEKDNPRGSEWTQVKPSMVRSWIDVNLRKKI